MRGKLKLQVAERDGESFIQQQEICPPAHISKPGWSEGTLLLHVSSPTAGMFSGDQLSLNVAVDSGASAILSTPAATRIHRMPDGGRAELRQCYRVASHGFLEVAPEWVIPQAGSRLRQETMIDVAKSGELLYVEALAPGRVAHGESFQFECLESSLRVRVDGRLAALEQFTLRPGDGSLGGWRSFGPSTFYAAMFAVTDAASESLIDALHNLHGEGLWIGASQLRTRGVSIKILGNAGAKVRKTLLNARQLIYQHMGRPAPSLRRL